MELIKVVNVKEVEGRTVLVERDARTIAGKLYGIDIPVYPFTVASFADDVEELKAKNDGVLGSEYLLDVATDVADTIDKTREMFVQAVAKKFPELKAEHKETMVDELMKVVASGVFGDGDGVLSTEVVAKLTHSHSDAFMYMYVLYRTNKIKRGHSAIKTLLLDDVISPLCQPFSLTNEGKLFIIDTVNTDSYLCGEESIIDVTDDVFSLMRDYNVIPQNIRSLREWLNTYEGTVMEAGKKLADSLARILLGYTQNDAIRVNVVKTAHQHMNDIARVALEKKKAERTQQQHILEMALGVADDVLRKHALKQVQVQDVIGADF